jgi:hypothetical protein
MKQFAVYAVEHDRQLLNRWQVVSQPGVQETANSQRGAQADAKDCQETSHNSAGRFLSCPCGSVQPVAAVFNEEVFLLSIHFDRMALFIGWVLPLP